MPWEGGVGLDIDRSSPLLVSRSQTAFSSFVLGREEKGSGERSIAIKEVSKEVGLVLKENNTIQ